LNSNGINGSKSTTYVILSEEETEELFSQIVREAFSPPYEFPPLPPEETS
jgi:hypothetical protein